MLPPKTNSKMPTAHHWLPRTPLPGCLSTQVSPRLFWNVLAYESPERMETQGPTLHRSVNSQPGAHMAHCNGRWAVLLNSELAPLKLSTSSPVRGQEARPNQTLHLQIIDLFRWPPTLAAGQGLAPTNHFHPCSQGVLCNPGSEDY